MATIKVIEGRSVHQIQSGQVIVDLNSVVKELVENSLDAGASSIEIRFKNHGLDNIEVQDNGKGISPDDYETVALKHYTSKLSSYEDLTSLDTFGFRGEALSSLCALSRLHIVTARAEDGAVGKRLDFETSGKLKSATVTAAPKGTTVAVENLFYNLPVRRKELDKNIKREYAKVIGLLHAYACICVGVKISVSNQMPKGKKTAVFSTRGNATSKENILNVFGAKTLFALVQLDLILQMEPSLGLPKTTKATDRSLEVHVEGYISKPVFGEGRQAPDRQMFFVNSRPCALPQVSKAVNEVYKSFNVTQSPFIFANMIMDTNAYDINVSPDKRTIMLHDQTALLERLKSALTELFEQTDYTVPQSTLAQKRLLAYQPQMASRHASDESGTPARAPSELGPASDEESDASSSAPVSPQDETNGIARGTPPSLIQNWINRSAESRRETSVPKRPKDTLSRNKQKLAKDMQQKGAPAVSISADDSVALDDPSSDESGNGQIGEDVHEHLGNNVPVEGSRDLDVIGTSHNKSSSQRPSPAITDYETDADSQVSAREPSIAVVTPSSQKATPGPVASAFDRMRPKRTPLQTAEITVGDVTTTTVIGSHSARKRRRIHEPKNSQAIAKFGASPQLARGLRSFVAPGSQGEIDGGGITPVGSRTMSLTDEELEEDSEVSDEDIENVAEHRIRPGHPPQSAISPVDGQMSDSLDEALHASADDDEHDEEEHIDEQAERIQQDQKVARLIREAEEAAARPTSDNLRRASQMLKNGGNRKESTLRLIQTVNMSIADIEKRAATLHADAAVLAKDCGEIAEEDNAVVTDEIDGNQAEAKLSLTVSKADFERMVVVGQFNLGFILAVRPASHEQDEDELFIIDQHAADEKYNYERLQRTVTLQSQRLVQPKTLELTAIEEEIILNHPDALQANGFEIETASHMTDDGSVARRCRLLTLPTSGEKTFDTSDLEELLHLLSEAPAGSSEIPRPRKVQRMLAMRACRSSIMVGKTLTAKQMQQVVRHMGEMEKPWNCPHGRPTMRHLAGLGAWRAWREGEAVDAHERPVVGDWLSDGRTDWKGWLDRRK